MAALSLLPCPCRPLRALLLLREVALWGALGGCCYRRVLLPQNCSPRHPCSLASSPPLQTLHPHTLASIACLPLLLAPHPSQACGLGRARAGSPCRVHAAFLSSQPHPPRRARSRAFAPAISVASFLALLLGAACICASGILNAGARFPGLCALHNAALLLCACRLPVGVRALYAHANVAQPGGRPRSCFRERPFLCGCVLPHVAHALHRSPVSSRSVYSWDACLHAARGPIRRFKAVLIHDPI